MKTARDMVLESRSGEAGKRTIEDIMREASLARERSPLSEGQMEAWRHISKNDAEEIQDLLDASPTYQEILKAQGMRD